MHEMSLAENIVQIIEEAASEQAFTHVKTVWLEIGQLTCVEPSALLFCFDVVAKDSVAKQSKLEIIEVAGQAKCHQCDITVLISSYYEACPQCGCFALQITQGEELRVKELEVE